MGAEKKKLYCGHGHIPISSYFWILTMVSINYKRSVVELKEEIIGANELTFHNVAGTIDTYMKQMQENYAYTLLNKNTATLQRNKK